MVSRSLIIWTLISIGMSFLWILISYFGIVRYLQLHYKSPEHFTDNYKKLQSADTDVKVVVTFTTNASKIKKLKPVINSLLDQTVKVSQISLTVPNKIAKLVPDDIKNYINIYKTSIDYGMCNSVIPSLLREHEQDTILVCIQDDQIYNKDLIENLVDQAKIHPTKAITTPCGKAILVRPKFFNANVCDSDTTDKDWIHTNLNVPCVTTDSCQIYKVFGLRKE